MSHSLSEMHFEQDSIFLHPWTLTLVRCHGGVCGSMASMSAQMLVQKSWSFLFSKFIFTLLNSHQSFGRGIRIIATDICCYIAGSFLKETPLQSMCTGLELSIFIPRLIFFWFLLLYICQSLQFFQWILSFFPEKGQYLPLLPVGTWPWLLVWKYWGELGPDLEEDKYFQRHSPQARHLYGPQIMRLLFFNKEEVDVHAYWG